MVRFCAATVTPAAATAAAAMILLNVCFMMCLELTDFGLHRRYAVVSRMLKVGLARYQTQ